MSVSSSGIGMTSERTRARLVEQLRHAGIADEAVLSVLGSVPRHLFVDEALSTRAYDDTALPIGFGQTISSPHSVARMSELLRGGQALGKVLEVGTGCGYQTAVLAKLAREVYSVERISQLLVKARANLRPLRLANVRLKHADGTLGLPEVAPFDAILITAATAEIPSALLQQLAQGGRMVFPQGNAEQKLCLIERNENAYSETLFEAVKFVLLKSDIA
jgi:protein-L-isoaspartate(D-aspartate) O-methyltransferase